MDWKTNDTGDIPHRKKRHLSYNKRMNLSKELQHVRASVYRKIQAKSLMNLGDIQAPCLYEKTVLRKAKQEQNDKMLSVVYGTNPIINLSIMTHETLTAICWKYSRCCP